jgi:hypothetical protein
MPAPVVVAAAKKAGTAAARKAGTAAARVESDQGDGPEAGGGLRWVVRSVAAVVFGGLFMLVVVVPLLFFGVSAPPASAVGAGEAGLHPVVLEAYLSSANRSDELNPGCVVRWQVLAAIGQVESTNATGRQVAENGDISPPIIGIALDGSRGTRAISDSDGGSWDQDSVWDRAVGPMQFIPTSWRAYGQDGNGDGVANPHNIYDASLATTAHLCGGNPVDLAERDQLATALSGYNNSQSYVSEVLRWVDTYDGMAAGVTIGPGGGPLELVTVGGITVAAHVAPFLSELLAAAAADGLALSGSGYRPMQRQIELRTINGCPDVWTAPASSCRVPTAIPGRSMHEKGEAVDFDNCSARSSRCFTWLDANAAGFGFYNLPSEPWHWSTTGG